ncbi:MAG: NADH-quinone oxidoreductase subunit NuoN [Gammaproteobacteria bacterium]|nr:NADH-quinone oxidoreductase subunit NuoN [Gammaproteobacteria bacterium]
MNLDFTPLIPEMFVAGMACVILVVDLYLRDSQRIATFVLSVATLVVAAVLCIWDSGTSSRVVMNGMFVDDSFADVLKAAISLLTAVVFIYSRDYAIKRDFFRGEYFVLGLFAVVGMFVMVSAAHLLTLYLGLELLSLCLYVMVAFRRDSAWSSEAAMKYFVLGAIGSGMMLYGMSLLYGLTGSLNMEEIRLAIAAHPTNDLVLILGLIFVLVSMAFKLGAVPFHMWVPDVYQGAPTAATLFVSTAPKIAAFAMMIRLLAGTLGDLHDAWGDMVIVMALLSIAIGNTIAIAQANLKRMLAYSAISHMGFMLLGVLTGTAAGYSAAMFYVLVYAFVGMGGFGMIVLLSRAGFEAEEMDDWKGLNRAHPWYAFLMLLLMISMAGIPPTIGFFAKLNVFQVVIEAGLVWVAVVAVLFAVVGAFYYLRVIKLMYFDEPVGDAPVVDTPQDTRVLLGINACAVVLLLPVIAPIQAMCVDAVNSLAFLAGG